MKSSVGAYGVSVIVNVTAIAIVAATMVEPRAKSQPARPPNLAIPATWMPRPATPRPPRLKQPTPTTVEFIVLTAPQPGARPQPVGPRDARIARSSSRPRPPAAETSPTPATEPPVVPAQGTTTSGPGRLSFGLGPRVLSSRLGAAAAIGVGQPGERDPNAWSRDMAPLSIGPRERTSAYANEGAGTRDIGDVEVTTSADGRLAMRNKAPINGEPTIIWVEIDEGVFIPIPAIVGKLDLTEIVAELGGYDLYYAKKLVYANDTREARAAQRQAHLQELAASADKLMQGHLYALWSRRDLSPAQKREVIYHLWRDAAASPLVTDPALIMAAVRVRGVIMRFIAKRLPAGSAHQYVEAELQGWNKDVPVAQRFAPCAPRKRHRLDFDCQFRTMSK
ncbi:MAG: hypothetical protein IPL79_00535 [Myxococcales bacterium]|nr:hypothetical protein [Myxococcales bacterium]